MQIFTYYVGMCRILERTHQTEMSTRCQLDIDRYFYADVSLMSSVIPPTYIASGKCDQFFGKRLAEKGTVLKHVQFIDKC